MKYVYFRKCDTPLRTIESMYRHINKEHKDIDFIYWTGDLPPHDIWNQEGIIFLVIKMKHIPFS